MTPVDPDWDIQGTGHYCMQDNGAQYSLHDPEGRTIVHMSVERVELLRANYTGGDWQRHARATL